MITIPLEKLTVKCSDRTLTADIGDIRVNLADNGTNRTLSFAFMVYTKDKKRMMQPYDMITRFEKPCTMDEAKELTAIYLTNFFDTIKSALSDDEQKKVNCYADHFTCSHILLQKSSIFNESCLC